MAITLCLGWQLITFALQDTGSDDLPPPQTQWYYHTDHQTQVDLLYYAALTWYVYNTVFLHAHTSHPG